MSQRQDFLDRLRNDFACPESWETMTGEDGCRFCASCRKDVSNFERMTPRQIRARLEAGRGKVCARTTRQGGGLLTLAEAEPPARRMAGLLGGRPSPFAAGLLTAILGLGAAAQPASPPNPGDAPSLAGNPRPGGEAARPQKRAADSAVLSGRVADADGRGVPGATVTLRQVPGGRERRVSSGDDGSFVFEKLPAGVYDLQAESEGFEVSPLFDLLLDAGASREADLSAYPTPRATLLGAMMMVPPSLLDLYDGSDLVVAAVVESSEILSVERNQAEVATRLIVERRIKGTVKERRVTYRHAEFLDPEDPAADGLGGLAPGDEVLGFLVAAPGGGALGGPVFETADFAHGVRAPQGAARQAYLERLEDLARLERAARGRAVEQAAGLMEWLVETAEDPFTRGEALLEIVQALRAFDDLAEEEGLEPAELRRRLADALAAADGDGGDGGGLAASRRAIFLGAAFTEQHRQRLVAALVAAESLSDADRTLFELVRDWDREATMAWVSKIVRQAEIADPDEAYRLYSWLLERAEELASAPAEAFAESAEARWEALGELPAGAEADDRLLREKRLALLRQLMVELADLLDGV